jgi:ATP-dependent DNA helicase RecG
MQVTVQVTMQVTAQVKRLLLLCKQPIGRDELQDRLGFKHREHFRKTYLIPALNAGFIEMTIPDKPNSRLQKYHLTSAGEKILQEKQKEKVAKVLPSTK